MKNTLADPSVGGKLDSGDKEALGRATREAIEWLDANQLAEVDELEDKKREVEALASPIFAKMYQGGGGEGGGTPGGGAGPQAGGPSVEEVD